MSIPDVFDPTMDGFFWDKKNDLEKLTIQSCVSVEPTKNKGFGGETTSLF